MSTTGFARPRVAMLIFVLLGGVASAEHYSFEISAEALPDAEDKNRFVLISLMPDAIDPEESARAIDRLFRGLGRAGFVQADSIESADIAISYIYGIGVPVFRIGLNSTQGDGGSGLNRVARFGGLSSPSWSFSLDPFSSPEPIFIPIESMGTFEQLVGIAERTGIDLGSLVRTEIGDPFAPNNAVIISSPGTETTTGQTVFPCFLDLVAFDVQAYRERNDAVKLWRTLITTEAPVPDFEEMLPAMLVAGRKYIGEHYEKLRYEPINSNGRAARYISGERELP